MTNIDLICAIEDVKCRRDRLVFARADHAAHPDAQRSNHLYICEFNVKCAEKRLADCMIQLQHGYDLVLLPKAQV